MSLHNTHPASCLQASESAIAVEDAVEDREPSVIFISQLVGREFYSLGVLMHCMERASPHLLC